MIILNKNPYEYYKMMINTYINDDNKYKTYISNFYDFIYKIINRY